MKNILRLRRTFRLILLVLLLSACSAAAEPTASPTSPLERTIPPSPTCTSVPPTATLAPTQTALPPTPITLPPAAPEIPLPATDTVCAVGCDFTTIQAAIDNSGTPAGAIIEIRDSTHTEAGIVVSKNVTIRGLGVDQTIVQAHENPDEAPARVFFIERDTSVVLEAMTIRHGKPAIQDDNGGGIRNFGALTLRNCLVTDNRADGGGGISNSGDLWLIDSTIAHNLADGIAPMGSECGNGGGIHCGSGNLMLLNSTVSYNQAGYKGRARGGGIFVGCGCQATLVNSTVSGNQASRESGREYSGGHSHGGGISVAGDLQLIQSTISHNRSTNEGGGIYGWGQMSFIATIIANNIGQGGNCVITNAGEIGTNLFNLVEGGGCGAMHTSDPGIGRLEDNGGPTETHALRPDSPVVDAVPADYCYLSTDQRGQPRPAAVSGDTSLCDLGAFELQP
jgi:hypothetical protein